MVIGGSFRTGVQISYVVPPGVDDLQNSAFRPVHHASVATTESTTETADPCSAPMCPRSPRHRVETAADAVTVERTAP
jgi:hypothetical protein